MLEIRLEARLNNKGVEDVLHIGESLCGNVGRGNLKMMGLRIFNSSHVINKRRSARDRLPLLRRERNEQK